MSEVPTDRRTIAAYLIGNTTVLNPEEHHSDGRHRSGEGEQSNEVCACLFRPAGSGGDRSHSGLHLRDEGRRYLVESVVGPGVEGDGGEDVLLAADERPGAAGDHVT